MFVEKDLHTLKMAQLDFIMDSFVRLGTEQPEPSDRKSNANRVAWIKEASEQVGGVPYVVPEDRLEEFPDDKAGDIILVSHDDYEDMVATPEKGAEITDRQTPKNEEEAQEEQEENQEDETKKPTGPGDLVDELQKKITLGKVEYQGVKIIAMRNKIANGRRFIDLDTGSVTYTCTMDQIKELVG